MTGIIYLDIAIGVIFILLIFSLFATALQEAIAGLFRWRGAALTIGLKRLLEDKFEDFWTSPLIEPLKGPQFTFMTGTTGKRAPSYIPPEIFAKAILDRLELSGKSPRELLAAIEAKPKAERSPIENRIRAVVTGVEGKVSDAEKAVADWYDNTMDQVSGWYTRRAQFVLFFIGFFMAVVTNTDLIAYAKELRGNETLRQALVLQASEIAALEDLDDVRENLGIADPASGTADQTPQDIAADIRNRLAALTAKMDATGARAGWSHCSDGGFSWSCLWDTVLGRNGSSPFLGWLLLAAGVMLGAQFWFDLLKTFVSIRSTAKPVSRPVATQGGSARNAAPPSQTG